MKNRTEIQDVQHDRYQLLKCKHIQRHREEKCKPRVSPQVRSYEFRQYSAGIHWFKGKKGNTNYIDATLVTLLHPFGVFIIGFEQVNSASKSSTHTEKVPRKNAFTNLVRVLLLLDLC